jgi:hypothetical protein
MEVQDPGSASFPVRVTPQYYEEKSSGPRSSRPSRRLGGRDSTGNLLCLAGKPNPSSIHALFPAQRRWLGTHCDFAALRLQSIRLHHRNGLVRHQLHRRSGHLVPMEKTDRSRRHYRLGKRLKSKERAGARIELIDEVDVSARPGDVWGRASSNAETQLGRKATIFQSRPRWNSRQKARPWLFHRP